MELLRRAVGRPRVFVASGMPQKTEAAALMATLVKRGMTITYDWTRPPPGVGLPGISKLDKEGVRSAAVVVVLMTLPAYDYKGTFTELGLALGAGKPIVLISPFTQPAEATCAKVPYFHDEEIAARYPSIEAFLAGLDGAA